MAEDYLTKKRTLVVLSEATCQRKAPPERTNLIFRIENRTAYMARLNNLLQLPAHCQVRVSRFAAKQPATTHSRTIQANAGEPKSKGNYQFRNSQTRTCCLLRRSSEQIETLFELKITPNMLKKDHTPQTIGEHFAASYLYPNHPVVSVLIDLNEKWTFFWFARTEDDSRMALCKLCLDGGQSAAEAKMHSGEPI